MRPPSRSCTSPCSDVVAAGWSSAGQNLTGTLPALAGLADSLQVLDLSINNITGPTTALAALPLLTAINIEVRACCMSCACCAFGPLST